MDRAGQIFDRRYRLERLLGQGGMAAVYVARDRKLDKRVAVKVLAAGGAAPPKAAQRFVQEARAASRVRHANVVDVTDYGVASDGSAYLVMELLRGEDLARTLEREGPLPWPRVGAIGLQICAALAAAHRVGVVHRDIKPANCVRLHSAGNPDFIKVLDFGIARVLDPAHRVVEPTTAGIVLGTPEYMAPEVAAGADAGPAADLYAVAALMYKLLTGAPPFVGDSYRAVLSKQIFEEPVPPRRRAPGREIPEAAEALILRALAKDPADRQRDMAALAVAIADALPQRPPVELWLAPSASGSSFVAADLPHAPDPPPGTASQGPTRTLVRPRTGRPARTMPLARTGWSPRPRWPLVALALGAALVGALTWIAAAWSRHDTAGALSQVPAEGHVSRDTPEQPPTKQHVLSDIPDQTSLNEHVLRDITEKTVSEEHVAGDIQEEATPDPASKLNAAPGGGAASAARRSRAPRFDAEAVRGELGRAAASVQTCALDSDMLRGEIAVRVRIDAGGRVAAVSVAPGSRRIAPGALACMRRELGRVRLDPVTGEVLVVYVI